MAVAREWVVAVRLANGSHRYFCAPGSRRGGQDEWSPRRHQALRFASETDAAEVAGKFEPNAVAKEYLVVRF